MKASSSAIKSAKAEMQNAISRAIEAFEAGATTADRVSKVTERMTAEADVTQWMMSDPSKSKRPIKRERYGQICQGIEEIKSLNTKMESERLAAEQHVFRLATMTVGLSPQKRARWNKAIQTAQKEIAILREMTAKRKENLKFVESWTVDYFQPSGPYVLV